LYAQNLTSYVRNSGYNNGEFCFAVQENCVMRADRLIAIILLLQNHSRLTAEDLARELEVSVRTIYRDMTALSAAGIPVYAERGPGGGCRLVEDYRTTLTGLTPDEVQALLLLRIPEPLADLGAGQALKAALRKVHSALPASSKAARLRLHLDWSPWEGLDPSPHLHLFYRAALEERRVRVCFRTLNGGMVEAVIEPLGLVAKAGAWLVVYTTGGRLRARRVDRFLEVQVLDERFTPPLEFDLAACWESLASQMQSPEWGMRACLRAAPVIAANPSAYFNRQARCHLAAVGAPDRDGWVTLEVDFELIETARPVLLALGGAVQVLSPEALRLTLVDFARQALLLYEM
jgi:predicted DNA-binding transcriptional regulator YafY